MALPEKEAMGSWNSGMLEKWVERNEIFLMYATHNGSVYFPLFKSNIPIFHHSILPMGHLGVIFTPPGFTKAGPSGPGSLLLLG